MLLSLIKTSGKGRFFLLLTNMAATLLIFTSCSADRNPARNILNFNQEWKFYSGDAVGASEPDYNDSEWRNLNLPHDWSIEGEFKPDNPDELVELL